MLTLNTPSLFANNPTTPAKIRAKNEVVKNPVIVLYDKRPNVFVSEIRHIANAIDVNTIGTITNCIEFQNN